MVAPGDVVTVTTPPPGDAFEGFRGRVGVVQYAVPGGGGAWVVAVERLACERATSHVLCAPENAFEFLAVDAAALAPAPGAACARPSYRPRDRGAKRKRDDDGGPGPRAARVAVVVPFRDAHVEQKRAAHLATFVPHVTTFLAKHCADYRVFVVEQSADGRKFNRGQLLNCGYVLAKRAGCDAFVFHDVDLLPSDDLGPWYAARPRAGAPCHVARVWDRYSGNPDYFGGVASWSAGDFERINGFPNNYWGWGGEDDEMMRRSKTVFGEGFTMAAPSAGSLEDLEDMGIAEKVEFLRGHKDWKCNVRWELRDEHAATWRSNGLRIAGGDLGVVEVATADLGDRASKVTVDLTLAGDWTDKHAPE